MKHLTRTYMRSGRALIITVGPLGAHGVPLTMVVAGLHTDMALAGVAVAVVVAAIMVVVGTGVAVTGGIKCV